MKTLTLEKWRELRAYLLQSTKPIDTIILLALETGARASEVVGLSFTWLDSEGSVFIRAKKGSKDRSVSISQDLINRIEQTKDYPDVFSSFSRAKTESSRRRLLDRRLRHCLAQIGAPERGMHSLRHTICSYLYQQTKDLILVRDWIGHRDIKSTAMYMALSNQKKANDIAKEGFSCSTKSQNKTENTS